MKFTVPQTMLPDDEHERFDRLHRYFCDQRAAAELIESEWVIRPYWPATAEYFADPDVHRGIEWWRAGLALDRIHFEVAQNELYQLSLNDSWTAYAWSRWLSSRNETSSGKVTILHVDYHKDLMSPRLIGSGSGFKDILTGAEFMLDEPVAVKASILSGAIGVGSFMVPFLHQFEDVEVRHLCDGGLNDHGVSNWSLRKTFLDDDLLQPGRKRPAISFDQSGFADPQTISYSVTSSEDEWLEGICEGPVLLHIDMDYFNCRYDGDSDWQNNTPRFDPTLERQKDSMARMFQALSEHGIHKQVEDIAVALSPGFFPVEFWQPMIQSLEAHLSKLKSSTT